MNNSFTYTGNELSVFEKAKNWKRYYLDLSKENFNSHLNILEIGAGIGGISKVFTSNLTYKSWTMIEPDKHNFNTLRNSLKTNLFKNSLIFHNIQLEDFLKTNTKNYDIVLIADVLEHISNDKETLIQIMKILNHRGKILIFVPAHQMLYSEFDKKIGHFRRYSKNSLTRIIPKSARLRTFKYIDSMGFFASLINKYFLKSNNPSLKQILFWDKVIIPMSRFFDSFLKYKFGKNIYCVISK